MKDKIKILLIIIIAFSSGTLAHATYHSRFMSQAVKNAVISGQASWYSKRSPGVRRRTANNEIFDDTQHTAAMWDVPFNQMVKVTNLENGKSIVVRVNDRGPHRRYVRKGRVIDLSRSAFKQISSLKKGLINIKLELL